MCVRGFEMVKGLDYEDNFSPTPGISIARLMVSMATANDLELHSVDIEQAVVQADKLKEGVNVRYFITPPPGSPDAGDKSIVYEVLKPLYGNPSSSRALHKTMDDYFLEAKDSILSGSKSQFGEDQLVENMPKIFLFRLMWMIVLLLVNLQII
jgi:hypothetical protein